MKQEHDFKYLECMWNDICIKMIECENNVINRSIVAGAIKPLVNKKELSQEREWSTG